MQSKEQKRQQMLNAPLRPLVCKMAIPTILTMLVSALYNTADTYFVGQLDTISTASVGLALPIMTVVQAIGFFFGNGSGNYISRKLGENEVKAAEQMADTAVVLTFLFGTVLMVLCRVLVRPLAKILGATPLLMDTSVEYFSILVLGIPFIMTAFTLNNQLRFQGSTTMGAIGMMAGSILNVILDPVLMFGFGMGLKGAAYATIGSQIVSFLVLLGMRGRFSLRKLQIGISREMIGSIFRFGTPSVFRQGIMAISVICMNNAAGDYGEGVIAAISVVGKVTFVGVAIVLGFGHGFQPICGFNLGAKRYGRVSELFGFCLRIATIFMLLFSIVTFVFAEPIVAFFRDDPEVIRAGIPLLRFQSATAIFTGAVTMTNMLLQNMGNVVAASFFALARQGIFFIPLVFVLPALFGIYGIYTAQAGADLLTAVITIPMTVAKVRLLKQYAASSE